MPVKKSPKVVEKKEVVVKELFSKEEVTWDSLDLNKFNQQLRDRRLQNERILQQSKVRLVKTFLRNGKKIQDVLEDVLIKNIQEQLVNDLDLEGRLMVRDNIIKACQVVMKHQTTQFVEIQKLLPVEEMSEEVVLEIEGLGDVESIIEKARKKIQEGHEIPGDVEPPLTLQEK